MSAAPSPTPGRWHGLTLEGRPLAARIRLADRWHQRAIGLLATRRLDRFDGLWLRPCAAIHMAGMAYPLDILFLDARGRILRRVDALAPWRAAACPGAHATLELRAGLARAWQLQPGATLGLSAPPAA